MATTREEVREKVITLLDDIRPHLEKKLDALLDSGAVNFDEDAGNWATPKGIMQALAMEMSFQYSNIHATRKDKQRITRYYEKMRLALLA